MAGMIPLTPPVSTPLPKEGYALIATEAGRSTRGLRATVQLWNGAPLAIQNLNIADAGERMAFAAEVSLQTDFAQEVIEQNLLSLAAGIEGVLREMVEQEHRSQDESAVPYKETEHGLALVKYANNRELLVPLCNFRARIVEEILRDDGAMQAMSFAIEGTLVDGHPLPRIEVLSSRYASMSWVTEKWGTPAVVYAGQTLKDHLRVGLQVLSGSVPRRMIFAHVGWRIMNGLWTYLHAGGAITPSGLDATVEVATDESCLRDYCLPQPPIDNDLHAAVRASLDLLQLAPKTITYPTLSAVYRAPLGETLYVDLSLFLSGPSGAFKTELSAILQAHWGVNFHGKNLPGNWSSTANTLERQAFLIKDAVYTVDDFAPTGTTADVARLHREADRLLRGQGNRAGRGRLRPDGTSRPVYYPRGMVIASGEDVPRGQSLRARVCILEIVPGDIQTDVLTQTQEHATTGKLAASMAAYLQWLAPQIESLKQTLPNRHQQLRAESHQRGMHPRTTNMIASLGVGLEMLLRFAHEAGVITEEERQAHWDEGWNALNEVAKAQNVHQVNEEPANRFLGLLDAALTSGHVHVVDAKMLRAPDNPERWGWREIEIGTGPYGRTDWQPQGKQIGWVEDTHLFLDPESAFAAIQRLARDQGETLAIRQRTLWKRLLEQGLLLSHDPGRNTARKTIAGIQKRVLHLRVRSLSLDSGQTGQSGQPHDDDSKFSNEQEDQEASDHEKSVNASGLKTHATQDGRPVSPVRPEIENKSQPDNHKLSRPDGEWEEGIIP